MLQCDHLLLGLLHVVAGVGGDVLRVFTIGRQSVAQVLAVRKLEPGVQPEPMYGKRNTLQTAIEVSCFYQNLKPK